MLFRRVSYKIIIVVISLWMVNLRGIRRESRKKKINLMMIKNSFPFCEAIFNMAINSKS